MKYKFSLISLMWIAFALYSCEETLTDTELPYLEKLVVMCVLEDGKPITKFEITKTLPPLYDDYWGGSAQDYFVAGVTGTIREGSNTYTITASDNVKYEVEGLIPEAGKTYKLTLRWKDKVAYASTTVPVPISIDSIGIRKGPMKWNINDSVDKFVAYFKPHSFSSYIGLISDEYRNTMFYDDHVKKYAKVVNSDYCSLFIGEKHIYDNSRDGDASLIVESWDYPFYAFWTTRDRGGSDNAIFSTSGLNIRWNIQGDGLGMFIGKSETFGHYNN